MAYTDLHCHLLWGLDDGAKTPEESVEMAQALVALGFADVAPSPHARPELAPAAQAVARRAEVQGLLEERGIPLRLHAGAENYLDDRFLVEVAARSTRPISTGPYVLIELPFAGSVPALPEMIFRIRLASFIPLFAHPERCAEFQRKGRASEAVHGGACLQLDVGALIGRYGREAKRTAEALLADGMYAVAATDLHSPVGASDWLARAIQALREAVGEAAAARLLGENPARILRGEEI